MENEDKSIDGEVIDEKLPKANPISMALIKYLEEVEQIENFFRFVQPIVVKEQNKVIQSATADIGKLLDEAKSNSLDGVIDLTLNEQIEKLSFFSNQLGIVSYHRILLRSLFFNLFSIFDAFIGDLLLALYEKKPELTNTIGKLISFEEIRQHETIESLKQSVISSEIESIRRESYIEQFKILENKFGIKLRQFENWKKFVECSQRRNILMHCDGVVSSQYLEICESVGVSSSDKIRERLEVDPKYLLSSIHIFLEVGLKLGQSLWRKVIPDEIQEADMRLNDFIFSSMKKGKKRISIVIGEYSLSLPKYSDDRARKMFLINCALAYYLDNQKEKAKQHLSKQDWSSSLLDFQLAHSIILEEIPKAIEIMERIGKTGDMVSQSAYKSWPLFFGIREHEDFLAAYRKIFESDYSRDLIEYVSEEFKNTEKEFGQAE